MIARALRVLPLPDSPTTATVSPRSTCRLTPSTSVRRVVPATKSTRRPSTASSCPSAATSAPGSAAEGEAIVDPVADDRHRGREEDDRKAGRQHAGGIREEEGLVLRQHAPPLGDAGRRAEA